MSIPKHTHLIKSNCNRDHLYCPVCGCDVLERYLYDQSPCAHVVYVYFDAIQTFAYIHPRYDSFSRLLEEELDIRTMRPKHQNERLVRFQRRIKSKSILHLSIETHPKTIGALSGTLRMGFDFDEPSL